MTKETIGATIERIAVMDLIEDGMNRAREEICQTCLDQRCKTGKTCNAFVMLSRSYAWEIAARNAELN